MSDVDDAMQEHMAYIVLSENKPFSYRDFLRFEVNSIVYKPSHGTIRNKFSELKKKN